MPTYQYACTEAGCGNQFELVQSFTDPSASECPVCGGPVRKVFSAVGVVFKGSGFYRNDSRGPANKSSEGASAGAEFSGGAKKESSESKSSDTTSSTSSSGKNGATPAPTPSSSPASTSAGKAAASA
jgi:putative FmdB family regulatory protein